MGNESTFLPALLDAFKNQSSYGARLEFQCTVAWSGQCWCLGRHNSPAQTQHGPLRPGAVGWQGNGGTSRWVGPGWWQEGGAATCSRSSSSSSQHAWYGTPMMGMGVYPHCSNVSILMMYLLPYAVILCWIYYISCTPFVTFHYRLLMSNFTFYYLWFTYIWLFKW